MMSAPVLSLLTVIATPLTSQQPQPRLEERIGLVKLGEAGEALMYPPFDALPPGTSVLLLKPNSTVVLHATVQAGPPPANLETELEKAGRDDWTRVALRVTEKVTEPGLLIGVLGATGPDLDGDGRPEVATICASMEGLHLALRSSGAPPQVLWTTYYYVGYDLESSCTAEDAKPQPATQP